MAIQQRNMYGLPILRSQDVNPYAPFGPIGGDIPDIEDDNSYGFLDELEAIAGGGGGSGPGAGTGTGTGAGTGTGTGSGSGAGSGTGAGGSGTGANTGATTGTGTGTGTAPGGTMPDFGTAPGDVPSPTGGTSAWDLATAIGGIMYPPGSTGAGTTQTPPPQNSPPPPTAPTGTDPRGNAETVARIDATLAVETDPAIRAALENARAHYVGSDDGSAWDAYDTAYGDWYRQVMLDRNGDGEPDGVLGSPTAGGGGSVGGGATGGGGSGEPPPSYGIGGAVTGYPGVWQPSPPQKDPSVWELLDGAWTLKDIFKSGGTAGVANDLVQGFVAGPGSAPPKVPGSAMGDFAGQVGDAIGALNLGKTLLDGDVSDFDKMTAATSYAFPALGAVNLGLRAIGVGGESSTKKAQRGYETWGAVNDAFLDALGRDAGASRNMGYNASGIKATNVDDLNFINDFLDSKDLRWGADTQTTNKDNLLRAGGVKGGELIDMYGGDIERLWSDLTGYYNTYDNAPKPGDLPTWGESAKARTDAYVGSMGGAVGAFGPMPHGLELGHEFSPGIQELLAGFGGDPRTNANYNPFVNDDYMHEYQAGLAYSPEDPWGFIGAGSGRESGGWSWW